MGFKAMGSYPVAQLALMRRDHLLHGGSPTMQSRGRLAWTSASPACASPDAADFFIEEKQSLMVCGARVSRAMREMQAGGDETPSYRRCRVRKDCRRAKRA
jgi:hypothetical protein